MGTENNLYKLLLEQLPEGIILSQEDGHIIYVNPAAETIRNIKEEDLIGNSIIDCHQESSKEKVRRAFEHLQKKPNMNFHRVVHDDANAKVYENTYASIQQDGVYCGLAVISRDVTKER
jgi:PAS domain S-box-containing protein